jgi:hypothetical protein
VSGPEDRDTEPAERASSPRSGGLLGWLFNPRQRRFILPATGAWILLLDWLLFSSNLLSAWLATPAVMLVGFVLGSVGTFLAQRRKAQDAAWLAVLKALLAGIAVGLPWPIAGTLVGGWVLLTSGLADAGKEITGR